MKQQLKTFAVTAAAALTAFSAPAEARSFMEALIDTTPAGLVRDSASRPGDFGSFWQDTVEGSKAIMKDGSSLWIVPTYTNHPHWDWENRHEENALPFGMGLGRQVIDSRGNERSFYVVGFVDSNYKVEPMIGYQWLARWPLGNTGFHVGAGYLAGITMRDDYMWLPCPLPLPVAKIGTDTVSFYGTYIPFTNVFFFYTTITIDDAKRRDLPLPASNPWASAQNMIYGGWGWEYVDSGAEEASPHNAEDDESWHVGMRHYSGRHWATDLSYRESSHGVRPGAGLDYKKYDFKTWALQIQYNIDAMDSLRLYAGAGIGYSTMKGQNRKDESIHPVLSLGATYAVTKSIFIDANVFTSFARFKGTVGDAQDKALFTAMPTDFNVSIGYAF